MARVTRTTRVSVGDVSKETVVVKEDKPLTFIFMFQVVSSNVSFIGHRDNKMYVQYKNESRYVFDGISKELFDSILKSESVGKAILATGVKGTKL